MTTAVKVDAVSKMFRLYHDRPSTLKERLVRFRRARYEGFLAVNDVSLEIATGETAGLIGPNGSGKSTLLKLIAGIMRPTSGQITTRGRIASLLELGAGFHPDLTGRENIFLNASILGLSKRYAAEFFDEIVAFAELEQFIGTQVRHYSSGMYVRLGFAVAVHVDPEILIVDEVLSVGDEAFQRKCLERIARFQNEGRTIVFVTHAADQVRTMCSRAFFLNHGKVAAEGNPNEVVREFRRVLHGDSHLDVAGQRERGTKEIKFVDVELKDVDGKEATVLEAGGSLDVVLTLESERAVLDPVVGFSLHDHQDKVLFGTNTAREGIEIEKLDGKMRVTFHLDSVSVLEGSVVVGVACHNRDENLVYHRLEGAKAIKVYNPGRGVGFVHVPVAIRVEREHL